MPRYRSGRVKTKIDSQNRMLRRSTAAIYQKLMAEFDLDSFLSRTAHLLFNYLSGVDAIAVFLHDDFTKQLKPASVYGCSENNIHEIQLSEGTSLIERAIKLKSPYLAKGKAAAGVIGETFHYDPLERGTSSLLCIPMILKRKTRIGCILFLKERPGIFLPADLLFLQTATRIITTFSYKVLTLQQAQQKNISNLACTLSHELRTPLTCIKGYVTTLLGEPEQWSPEERTEFLKIIDSETDTMTKLIGELTESSMIESGLLSIVKEPVLLENIIRRAVSNAKMNTENHRFIVSIPGKLPVLDADPGRIRQVLDNLLDNAVKYSPQGGMIVAKCYANDKEVILSVADEGIGITPEHLNRLFEKFFRVKSDFAGTGLGLPVAREIVEKHGGRIWAMSTPEKGSTFFFTLPLTERDQTGIN